MFYSKKCGAIKSVKIEKRQKKATYDKAKYALVEFAHKDSVEVQLHTFVLTHTHTYTHTHSLTLTHILQLAIDLMRKGEARIGAKCQPVISQAGLSTNAAATAAAKSVVRESDHGAWTAAADWL